MYGSLFFRPLTIPSVVATLRVGGTKLSTVLFLKILKWNDSCLNIFTWKILGRTSTSLSAEYSQAATSLHKQLRGPLGNRDNKIMI